MVNYNTDEMQNIMVNYNTDEMQNKILRLNLVWVHERSEALRNNVCTPHGEYAQCLYIAFLWLINKHCPPPTLRWPIRLRACTLSSINANGAHRYRELRERGYIGQNNGKLYLVEETVNIQINAMHRFADDPEPFLIGFDYNI